MGIRDHEANFCGGFFPQGYPLQDVIHSVDDQMMEQEKALTPKL